MGIFSKSPKQPNPSFSAAADLVRSRRIEYVLINVRDEEPYDTAFLISKVTKRAGECSATILEMGTSVIFVAFGALGPTVAEPEDGAARLLERLRELGNDVRALHGETDAVVGNVGTDTRMAWTALVPSYTSRLSELLALRFGEIASVRKSA